MEVSDQQVKVAVIFVITQRDAHAAHGVAVLGEGHAAGGGHVGKGAVVIVVIKVGIRAVVGDEKIRPAIVVIVARTDGKVKAVGLVYLLGASNVRESAIAAVVVEHVGAARIYHRPARVHHSVPDIAGSLAVRKEVGITAHVEVQSAIAVVVEESSRAVKGRSKLGGTPRLPFR